MNGTRRPFELIALGGAAFILSGAILYMILGTEQTAVDGNPTWRMVLAVTYSGVALVLVPWYRETLFILRRNWALVTLLMLAMLSSIWAEIPDLVFRKSIGLFGTTLFGIALAVRMPFEEQIRMFVWLFRILAVLSVGCLVLFPSYGISSEGDWTGVFYYKNAMGSAMGLALLLEWQLPVTNRLSRVLKILATLMYVVLLLKSDSVTPAVALAGTLILLSIYRFAALKLFVPLYAFILMLGIGVLICVPLVIANGDKVIGLLGRSSNLTGRTEIWGLVISFIQQKPVLGYGYSGFWLGASPESFVVNRVMGGPVMYSHNGYLEMLLTLGVLGFLLTLVFIGSGLKRALYLSKQPQFPTHLWPLAFLFYFILHNLGECTILAQELEWAMCVSCIVGTDVMLLASSTEEEEELPLLTSEVLG